MIPVILPYHRTLNSDESLRFALRSLDKHITGIGEVIIVGDEPEWHYQNLTILRCGNAYNDDRMRDANIYYKMKLGFEQVSDRALVMHDDNFFLMYSTVEDWPWYYSDWPVLSGGIYKEVVELTQRLFTYLAFSDVHCAHVITKSNFNEIGKLNWGISPGYCIKTLCAPYGELKYITDLKLKAYHPAEEIRAMIKGRHWFSAADNAMNAGGLRSVLNELYPEKSRYEV